MSYISITAHPAIELPLPPEGTSDFEMEVYAKFMRHLRCVPNSRAEIKILSSISFTADMMVTSDEHVAKVLVEAGLRAPRSAFPQGFLAHIDQSFMREGHSIGAASEDYISLGAHWRKHGEDPFAAHRYFKPVIVHSYNHRELEHETV